MATLNHNRSAGRPKTHEGALAHRLTPEQSLRRTVMACMLWEDGFYEDGQTVADRIAELVPLVGQEVAARTAIEARESQNLRHVPLLIVREMARYGGSIVGETLARVIQRPDELSEFLAIYWKDGREPLAAQVKKGLARAFTKFDGYQLAKWDRDDRAVRLRDVLFLSHAKPEDEEQAALWSGLIDGTLPTPDTWEAALSSGADKRETWERMIADGKLGGMALLRNLRNMLAVGVPDATVRAALDSAKFSRVLPFRFIAAARHAPSIESSIEAAMLRGMEGAATLPGHTVIVVDHSSSMKAAVSGRSEMSRFDAACGVAILLREICERVSVIAYSSPYYGRKYIEQVPDRRGFALRDALHGAVDWGGTYTEDAKRAADTLNPDRIVIVTDEQSHQRLSDPEPGVIGYVVNVATDRNGVGYGRWVHVDGWSESVVNFIQELEKAPE